MPSRRRIRHASTNNTPQVLLSNNNSTSAAINSKNLSFQSGGGFTNCNTNNSSQSSSSSHCSSLTDNTNNNANNNNNNNSNSNNYYLIKSDNTNTNIHTHTTTSTTTSNATNNNNSSKNANFSHILNHSNNSNPCNANNGKNININNIVYSNQYICSFSINNNGDDGNGDGAAAASSDGALTDKQIRNAYLSTLTKEQLKFECKKRGQKTNGNRTELLQRLGVKMSQLKNQEQADYQNRKAVNNNNTNKNFNHNNHNMGNQNVKKATNQKAGVNSIGSSNGTGPMASIVKKSSAKNKEKEREEREKIVLWRRPFQTVKYCVLECATLIQMFGKKLLEHTLVLLGVLVLIALLGVLYNVPGRHQLVIETIRSQSWFIIYWVGLGVLSSVGLGTGLHTFLLYLGPHIASVTLAAYECNALNFPKPPYPDEIICPEVPDESVVPNLWNIMAKVRFEAFLWGAGTALGELPPYFMAKAARLSGIDPDDDDDLKKFEELQKKQKSGDLSSLDKAKLFMEKVVEKVGFLGILACASIPNPLFDLAGITCGHFLVPFWTFFGATLLGKAVIKMHIQKIFVIIAFNESLIERAVDLIVLVPIFGRRLQEPFKTFLENQKTRLHRQKNQPASESGNLLAKIFEKFVIAMICYFVISIINSLAQSYHKRIHKKGGKVHRKIAKD